jgi:hypothetical protein
MKGKDIIAHAIRAEMPDMERLRLNCIHKATAGLPVKRNVWVNRLVPVAACAVITIALFFAMPYLRNNTPNEGNNNGNNAHDEQGGASAQYPPDERQTPQHGDNLPPPEFVGLPVVNHCLPQENPNASRMGVGSLLDILGTPGRAVEFWANNPVQAFAFVRVMEAVQEENTLTSTVEVLRTVWSRGRELPETMTLVQNSGAIMCCTPYGEMMREGGVFLLPLWYNDGTMQGWRDGWFNWTYRDVLFEIDDNGLVWSRSNLSAFNRFDGKHTSVLTGAILGITNGDENLGRDVAHTIFGWAADEGALAIITIASSESNLLFPTGQELWQNSYVVHIDELLSTPTPFGLQRGSWLEQQQNWRDNWRISEKWWQDCEQNNEISIVVTDFARSALQVGGRYLVFITPSYSDWHSPFTFFSESVARINADGTITSIPQLERGWEVFGNYDGYTVERLAERVYLANTWHERYSV